MKKVRLSEEAQRNLKEIESYTEDSWGSRGKKRYRDGFKKTFSQLGHHPKSGPERNDIGKGVRILKTGSHFLLYEITSESVTILTIRHQSEELDRVRKQSRTLTRTR